MEAHPAGGPAAMRHWRIPLLLLATLLAGVLAAALLAYRAGREAANECRREQRAAEQEIAAALLAEEGLAGSGEERSGIHAFLVAWRPHFNPSSEGRPLASTMRGSLEALAQRRLGLITDQGTTPEPLKLVLGGRSWPVQRLGLRASGSSLNALLAWMGEVESLYPAARIESWELSATGVANSALRLNLAQPLRRPDPSPSTKAP